MKLEKEVYLGNVHYIDYNNGNYHLKFSCTVSNGLIKEEKEIFDKLQKGIKVKLTLEAEEPILDEEERKYLSGVIRPFRDKVIGIYKRNCREDECIYIGIKDDIPIMLPCFKKTSMYKGMELNKEYTLKDLGL